MDTQSQTNTWMVYCRLTLTSWTIIKDRREVEMHLLSILDTYSGHYQLKGIVLLLYGILCSRLTSERSNGRVVMKSSFRSVLSFRHGLSIDKKMNTDYHWSNVSGIKEDEVTVEFYIQMRPSILQPVPLDELLLESPGSKKKKTSLVDIIDKFRIPVTIGSDEQYIFE